MTDETENRETRDERDDRLLSAYIDGELSDAEADEITERLAREPRLARRLEALRSADPAAKALFARLDELPLPQGVLDLLQANEANKDTHNKPAAGSNVVPFPRRVLRDFWQAPVAIAASVALVAGFVGSRLLLEQPAGAVEALYAQQIPDDSDVYQLLENGIGSDPATLADGSQGQLMLTFADRDGDWCRQLAVARDETRLQALACRRDGTWRTETLAFGQPASGAFGQASSSTPPAMYAAIDRLISGEPLDRAAERTLVLAGWKKD